MELWDGVDLIFVPTPAVHRAALPNAEALPRSPPNGGFD
jgi:hypothetical protein